MNPFVACREDERQCRAAGRCSVCYAAPFSDTCRVGHVLARHNLSLERYTIYMTRPETLGCMHDVARPGGIPASVPLQPGVTLGLLVAYVAQPAFVTPGAVLAAPRVAGAANAAVAPGVAVAPVGAVAPGVAVAHGVAGAPVGAVALRQAIPVPERLQRLDDLPPPLLLLGPDEPVPVPVKPERLEAPPIKPEKLEPVPITRVAKPEFDDRAAPERGTVAPLAGLILRVGAVYQCALCTRIDGNYTDAAMHVWHVHKGGKQLCPHCPGLSFNNCHTIRAHLREAHGRTHFACATCPALFSKCYNYIRHQCRYKLSRHYMREHCPVCMAYCAYGESARVEHVERVHGQASVTCPACSVKCESYAAYKVHESVCGHMTA